MFNNIFFSVQIRSQRDSNPVPYLYLPDELLLLIFSFLPHKDLVSCSRVCWQFYRISMDESLCKNLTLSPVYTSINISFLHFMSKLNKYCIQYLRTKPKFVYFLVINNYNSFIEIKNLVKNLLSLNFQ